MLYNMHVFKTSDSDSILSLHPHVPFLSLNTAGCNSLCKKFL